MPGRPPSSRRSPGQTGAISSEKRIPSIGLRMIGARTRAPRETANELDGTIQTLYCIQLLQACGGDLVGQRSC